jgi:ribose transport system substrate-binding protein
MLVLALSALVLAACAAPGAPAAPTPPPAARDANAPVTIGVSFDILNNIRQAERVAIEAKAKEMGATIEFAVADSDAQRQVSQIEELLTKKVDAIIAIPQDKDVIVSAVQKANAAGVPFVTLDRSANPDADVLFHVGTDPYSDGQASAQYLAHTAAAQRRDLKVLVLVGALSDVNAVERNRGFQDEIANWPNITIVQEAQTDWKPEKAQEATAAALQQHSDLNAIFSPSDYLLPSVLTSLEAANRMAEFGAPGHIKIVSIDGDPFGYSKTVDGTVSANVATLADVMGMRAAEVAIKAARGEKPATSSETIRGLLFSHHNAEKVAPKVWGAQVNP